MTSRDPAELRKYLAVTAELQYRGAHPNHKDERFPRPYTLPFPNAVDSASDSGDFECMTDRNQRYIREVGGGEAVTAYNAGTDILLSMLRSYQKKGENIGYMGEKRKQLVVENGYDSKNAAHCIRLLKMVKEFLGTGSMTVYRIDDRDELLAIKRGKWLLQDLKEYAEQLFAEVKTAWEQSPLPEQPDRATAEKLLIKILREHLA